MQARLLKGKAQEGLLIFFTGWGLDERPFASLTAQSPFDLFILFDYRELSLPPWPEGYPRYYVLGWSLGGVVALKLAPHLPYPLYILGATGFFCHPRWGIPPKIFALTLSGLKKYGLKSLKKFYQNMFREDPGLEQFLKNPPQRPLAALIEELEIAQNYTTRTSEATQVIITAKDPIIPPRAQQAFWQGKPVQTRPWGHFPFYRFRDFSTLLRNFSPEV